MQLLLKIFLFKISIFICFLFVCTCKLAICIRKKNLFNHQNCTENKDRNPSDSKVLFIICSALLSYFVHQEWTLILCFGIQVGFQVDLHKEPMDDKSNRCSQQLSILPYIFVKLNGITWNAVLSSLPLDYQLFWSCWSMSKCDYEWMQFNQFSFIHILVVKLGDKSVIVQWYILSPLLSPFSSFPFVFLQVLLNQQNATLLEQKSVPCI